MGTLLRDTVLRLRLARHAPWAGDRRRLALVVRRPAPRPRWGVLYATTATIAAVSFLAIGATDERHRRLVEVLMAVALITAMALWRRANRSALTWPDERPRPGRVRVIRIVRSRPQALLVDRLVEGDRTTDKKIIRLDPDARGVLPYPTTPGHGPGGRP